MLDEDTSIHWHGILLPANRDVVPASAFTALPGGGEYDLLLTSRLKLQPLAEVDVYGKADPERGLGAGLAATEFGVRVRYGFAASGRRTPA